MRLARRSKVRVYAKVEADAVSPEPHPSTPGEVGGLRFLAQAQHASIELARESFLASRHGELDVVECDDFSQTLILSFGGAGRQPFCLTCVRAASTRRCPGADTAGSVNGGRANMPRARHDPAVTSR